MSFCVNLSSNLKIGRKDLWTPIITAVRFRYHKDKKQIDRKSYDEKLLTHGPLPRSKEFKRIYQMKPFYVQDPWKTPFTGQNDYIDILGDGDIRPIDVQYNVPKWLRGFKGNEFQMLLHRRNTQAEYIMEKQPAEYNDMLRRMAWLYWHLNHKRQDFYSEKR